MKELFDSSYLSVMSEEITRLREENKQLKNIIKELEEWLEIKEEKETVGTYSMVLDKIQELKEKYK